jgi:ketosteroid isomerase-like protein
MIRPAGIAAAALFTMLVALPAAAQSDEDAVRAVVTDFHQALSEGYREGVLRLLAEDAVIFETGYVEANREQYASGHLDADLLYAATVRREPVHRKATVVGDLAYVISQSRNHGEFQGEAVNLTNTETMVLRRDGESWRIVHIHWSGHEAPADAAP